MTNRGPLDMDKQPATQKDLAVIALVGAVLWIIGFAFFLGAAALTERDLRRIESRCTQEAQR